MPKAPRLKGKDLLGALQAADFRVIRVKGSHHFVRHSDGRTTVVPVHAGEIIGVGLLAKILKDVDMTTDDLRKLL